MGVLDEAGAEVLITLVARRVRAVVAFLVQPEGERSAHTFLTLVTFLSLIT